MSVQNWVVSSCARKVRFLLGLALIGASGCAKVAVTTATAGAHKIAGAVHGGQQPVTGASIQLYAVGTTGDGSEATPLILTTATTSDGSGNAADGNGNPSNSQNQLPAGSFTLAGDFVCPVGNPSAEVYLVARGGNPGLAAGTKNSALAMMAAIGPCNSITTSTNVFINELTTVGSIAALYPYMTGYGAIGSATGDATALQSAFATVNEYTNTATGTVPGPALPASTYASSYEINTLGDAIAACINSTGSTASGMPCAMLFTDATPAGVGAPSDTIGALLNIEKNPGLNVCAIYGLVPALGAPFQPTLSSCPANWSLPISAVTVGVSGASSVYEGSPTQYTAMVTGVTNQTVAWAVNGVVGGNATVGTISATGIFMPPMVTATTPETISATSALSSTAVGFTNVTVQPVTVSVTGPLNVLFGATGQYSATVTGGAQTVTWTVNGIAGGNAAEGTITTAGVYTAPATTPAAVVTIGATSAAVTSVMGSLGITVSPTTATYATGDTRTVTQPGYPAICTTVFAQFSSSQRSTPPAAASDDTGRLQAALNTCKNTGGAVELAASGTNDSFFSELITVTGEGLTVDANVNLFGGATYTTGAELVLIAGANSSLNGPGTIDGRGDIATGGTPRLVQATNATNLTVYNITLAQALKPNLYISGGSGITIWGITTLTPATRANADGIDLDSLTNATVTNSTIEAGDDGVAVKSNNAASSNVTVTNNKLYGTHGLSIGSENYFTVTNVLFQNNYVYGSDFQGNLSASSNGLVIKSDPACQTTVQQVTYRNTCISGVKHLITFYTNYAGTCTNNVGSPVFTDIVVNGVVAANSISGAYSEFIGYSAAAPSNASLAYVSLDANALNTGANVSQYATISLDNSTLTPTGTGIVTNTWSTPGSVPTCTF